MPQVLQRVAPEGGRLGWGSGWGSGSDSGSDSGSAWDTARDRRRGLSHARRARSVPAPTQRVKCGGAPARILRERGMTQTPAPATSLPHHKLFAYELCLSLVKLVAKTRVADAQLRAQARKSAASAALNCAEGAARQTRADKSRAYAIALCECCEACATDLLDGARAARSEIASPSLNPRPIPRADARPQPT